METAVLGNKYSICFPKQYAVGGCTCQERALYNDEKEDTVW